MENKNLPAIRTKHTLKKVKILGTQEYIDPKTGEYKEFQVQDIAERDFNFTKVWMRQFIQTLDLLGNQKTKVALWIIDHLNRENQLIATQRQISEEANVSYKTVADTMKVLKDSDFLKRMNYGGYIVNADILYKGSRGQRLNVLNQYHDIKDPKPKKLTVDEKIRNLEKVILNCQNEIAKLQGKEILDIEVDDQYSFDIDGNIVQKSEEIPNE